MKAIELKQKSTAELGDLLLDLRREQFSMRMQQAGGQAGRPHQIRQIRRDIARIKTIINEQQTKAGVK